MSVSIQMTVDSSDLDRTTATARSAPDYHVDAKAAEAQERLERRRLILLQGRTDNLINSVDQTF